MLSLDFTHSYVHNKWLVAITEYWIVEGDHVVLMARELDCGLKVCDFKFQSRYYVHFRFNTFG